MERTPKAPRIMALLAGTGAAVAVLTLPVGLLELVVSSTGVSELVPATAPPLGETARLLVAGFAGTMTAGAAMAIGHADATDRGEEKMGFALSKLTAMARGGRERPALQGVPTLRRADAHPDAPARRPIFASEDFGASDIFARPVPAPEREPEPEPAAVPPAMTKAPVEAKVAAAPAQTLAAADIPARPSEPDVRDEIVDGAGLPLPAAPEPLSDSEIAVTLASRLRAPMFTASRGSEPTDLDRLSIGELAERFERGLARRAALRQATPAGLRAGALAGPLTDEAAPFAAPTPSWPRDEARLVLADIPAARPVPIRAQVDAEVDQALRAALGTLRSMALRAS